MVFLLMVAASNSAPTTNEIRIRRSADPQNPLGLFVPPRRLRPRPNQPIRNLVRAGIVLNNLKVLGNAANTVFRG